MSKEQSNINTARAYASVFRGSPWNEAFKDQNGQFFGEEYDQDWRQLGLILAYPLIETAAYISKELNRPDSVYVTKTSTDNPNRVEGFGWGFAYSSAEILVAEKWSGLSDDSKQSLTSYIRGKISDQTFWYLSEVGVLPNLQSKGVGTQIVESLVGNAPAGQPIIMRTNAYSPMTVIAAKLGFIQIYGPSTQKINGQIVVNKETIVGGIDEANQDRVLYLLNSNRSNNE